MDRLIRASLILIVAPFIMTGVQAIYLIAGPVLEIIDRMEEYYG
jgi:hypothetical protein